MDYYRLLKEKFSIYIFTSGTLQEHPQIAQRLNSFFENIFSAQRLGMSKVKPKDYSLLAEKLDLKPAEILLIDDNPVFIRAARQADLKTIRFIDALPKTAANKVDKKLLVEQYGN